METRKIREEKIETRTIPIEEIIPAPYNPRIMDNAERERLKHSIKKFHCVQLIVWNSRTRHAVGGNQTLGVLKELGYKEVEVAVVDLSLEDEKALNIALNKISERWDEDRLAVLLRELSELPNFDVSLTGFDTPEISQIFDRYREQKDADDFDAEKVADSIIEPITKRGDIITLGKHRLMCGDSTSTEDLNALLNGEKIDLIDLDWPYNVNLCGGSVPRDDTRPKKSRKWDRIYSDNLPQDEYEVFMRNVLVNIKAHLKPGAAFYQWQAHRQLGPLYQILVELDFHVSCLICWTKESATISFGDYSFQTEQAVYGWLKGQNHYFAGKPGESNLWQVKRDPTATYKHPCQKPVILAERAITNSSRRNDVVLDVFMGSGSVLIAAESLERRCFGMELDPKYCDVIVRRYIAYKGADNVPKALRDKYLTEARHG